METLSSIWKHGVYEAHDIGYAVSQYRSEDKYKFSHPATIEAKNNIPNRTEFKTSKQT